MSNQIQLRQTDELLERLLAFVSGDHDLPAANSPLGHMTRDFFNGNWSEWTEGPLAGTNQVKLRPMQSDAPRTFRFEVDLQWLRSDGSDGGIQLVTDRPLEGTILYRPDLFERPTEPSIAVRIPMHQGFFNPNYSRQFGLLCLGGQIPNGPFGLVDLVEHYLYPTLTYQAINLHSPADIEAARYFATEPDARRGMTIARLY